MHSSNHYLHPRESTVSSQILQKPQLTFYSLAAGAMAAGAAHAAPTPSPNAPASFTTPDNSQQTVGFDMDGDGTDDFEFSVSAEDDCTDNRPGLVNLLLLDESSVAMATDGFGYAANVAPGATVPGSLDFPDFTSSQNYLLGCDNNQEEFSVGEAGFLGVQFESGGNTHNGYIQVEFGEGSIITNILEACYEDVPGAPILVGACNTSPIPVNGVVIPLTLSLLAMGGLALRRRRGNLQAR